MLRGLFDFHIGPNVSELRVDVKAYVAQVKRMGISTLAFMTKDAMGWSYYDTKVGRRNPRLTQDLLRVAIREAHANGIRIVTYYNVALNDYLGKEHPDWRQVDGAGKSALVFNNYSAMCMNTPYREVVRGQLKELAGEYESDGVWLDISYIFPGRCHCPACQRAFRQEFGRPMPAAPKPGSADMARYQEFRRRTRREFITDLVTTVRGIRGKDFPVGWNHAGDIDFAQIEVDRLATLSSCEFHAPEFDEGYYKAAGMRGLNKPFELMMPECMSGWGEWTVSPVATMKAMGAIALSSGGALNLGHVVVPSGPQAGVVAGPVVEHYAAMSRWLAPREEACRGLKPTPCAAILTPAANQRAQSVGTGTAYDVTPDGVHGAHRVLLDTHWPADLLSEDALDRLAQYEVVLLPEIRHVPAPFVKALDAYVRKGGTLIVEGRTGSLDADGKALRDFSVASLTGSHLRSACEYTNRYIVGLPDELAAGLPAMPLLARSPDGFAEIRTDAEVLARFMDPEYEATPQRHVYHQHAHPAVTTDSPAITLRRLGKGRVVHVVAPLSASYWLTGHPWPRMLMGNILRAFVPNPLLRVDAPPSVRVTAMAGERRLAVHFVCWHQEPKTHGPSFVETETPVSGMGLSVRGRAPRRVLHVDSRAREIPFTCVDGRIEIRPAAVRTHALIVVEW